jgi:hypothetical protein
MWTANTQGNGKYGMFWGAAGRKVGAHRASWELAHGPVPAEMNILHSCDRGLCVRPSHLFVGTQADNNRDCVAKGRAVSKGKTGRFTNYGRHQTEAAKAKIAAARRGYKHTEETRAKFKLRVPAFLGRRHSAETKARMSLAWAERRQRQMEG